MRGGEGFCSPLSVRPSVCQLSQRESQVTVYKKYIFYQGISFLGFMYRSSSEKTQPQYFCM